MLAEWYTPRANLWNETGFKEDLKYRNFNYTTDLHNEVPSFYRYAKDGFLIHDELEKYITASINLIYQNDGDVVSDQLL